ncbi:hypothetical protein BLS_001357 [Venturia inaequalis]|uniref:Gfo/Idh/MocA-like oxidoreductase N-terminal domain-containing protein n=1 Tax=Venturia inaequalis TaxID=5025 RepID=A0A8H3UXL5_VENIN|nr:hypothetical protein EG328_002196 [Venturia inaequalis]KAE9984784.1 hypothetical protein BLS_001357 [Venturia inaequalis]RDI83048.1 hypothetical protein Vi05172_g7001 [Venturia inaequalis]
MTAPNPSPNAPRIVVIGAGSQGNAYSAPIAKLGFGTIAAVCDPIASKRKTFGRRYIWGLFNPSRTPLVHEEFDYWQDFIKYEVQRRERVKAGEIKHGDAEFKGIDAAFVCVLDELHVHVIKALAPLGIHIMCEKPLASRLNDCVSILGTMKREWETLGKKTIFGIGHVLRYSPQNVLLRKLVREEKVLGDLLSVEHTEPIGWWHMAHSFVRGNWRREDTTAPSLLAKSCHDIDFLMWLIASPASPHTADPRSVHLPSFISSTGTLNQFRKARKPIAAGSATNCLSCPIESSCLYSAKNIYLENLINKQNVLDWPVDVIVPEMEDLYRDSGKHVAVKRLLTALEEDYIPTTPNIKDRAWYGRCVWECDNDVCDDQVVTITWEDDPLPPSETTIGHAIDGTNIAKEGNDPLPTEVGNLNGRAAKTAIFHMIASTEKICERRGRIYGTKGELTYDLDYISVNDFITGKTTKYSPPASTGGHGGGDGALAENFCKAVQAVNEGVDVEKAQRRYLGVTIEEVVRSHVAVFAAERARLERRVVDWDAFWEEEVVGHLDRDTHEG